MARTRNPNRQLTAKSEVLRVLGDQYGHRALALMLNEKPEYAQRLVSGYTVDSGKDIANEVWDKTKNVMSQLLAKR